MKLNEIIETIGTNKPLEEAKKKNNPNVFQVPAKYKSLYEYFSENKESGIEKGPIDIAKILKTKIYSKSGESNLGPNSMKLRSAFNFIGRDKSMATMTGGWDGGVMTREVIRILTPYLNQYMQTIIAEGKPFKFFNWHGLYEEVRNLLIDSTEFIQARIDRGMDNELPSARAILDDGSQGATLAEFIAFIFVYNLQQEYYLDRRTKTKEQYLNELKQMKILVQTDIASLESELDIGAIDPEATDSPTGGARTGYTQ